MVTRLSNQSDAPLVVFAGGGTGGHLFPALSVLNAIRRSHPTVRFLYFSTDRPIDAQITDGVHCDVIRQPMPQLRGSLRDGPAVLFALRRMGQACRARLVNEQPAAVISSGGLSAIPALREAHRRGVPIFLLNPDSIPGKVHRCFSSMADTIFVQWQAAAAQFPPGARVVVSGCPVREEFLKAKRASGIERFRLDPNRRTLLAFGASQGARTINDAVMANLDLLVSFSDWQVLHVTGTHDRNAVEQKYERRGIRAAVLEFTEHMVDALSAADLVVSRAGASSLAEITATGVASILMPYPFHRDGHQMANARCLSRASAAVIVEDKADPEINGPALGRELLSLMRDGPTRSAMSQAARTLGRTDAAERIAGAIMQRVSPGHVVHRVESLKQLDRSSRYDPGIQQVEEYAATCKVL